MPETQRYRVEKFRADGRWLASRFFEAESYRDAEVKGRFLMDGAPLFRHGVPGVPYVHVTLSPHRPSYGTCSRCGNPRYRCGGEADPHE